MAGAGAIQAAHLTPRRRVWPGEYSTGTQHRQGGFVSDANNALESKKYTEYKLYQAVLYPLNGKPIRFPEIGLNMLVKQV